MLFAYYDVFSKYSKGNACVCVSKTLTENVCVCEYMASAAACEIVHKVIFANDFLCPAGEYGGCYIFGEPEVPRIHFSIRIPIGFN